MKGQFSASSLSRAARQAIKMNGLATVSRYDLVNHVTVNDPILDARFLDVVVIRAYSPSTSKQVEVTAGDIYLCASEYQEAPMARVARS